MRSFGFELFITNCQEYYRKKLKTSGDSSVMIVKPITRQIMIDSESTYIQEVDALYDLIKADLVVKE